MSITNLLHCLYCTNYDLVYYFSKKTVRWEDLRNKWKEFTCLTRFNCAMQMNAIELLSWNYGCCLPSLIETKQKNQVCKKQVCKSFDFGSSLQNVYPLLRFVFEYLRLTDLESAGKVNDTWGKYAEEELARRSGPSWLRLSKLQTARYILERSVNFMYDEVTFSLVFYKNGCSELYMLNNLQGMERIFIEDYFTREALPKGTEFWTFRSRYVSHNDKLSPGKLDTQFSILSIPSIPHVAIRRLVFPKGKPPGIRNILEENVQSDEVIDCLLVFCWVNPEKHMETFVHEILRRQEANTIALGGGVAESIHIFNRPNPSDLFYAECDDICCIAFTRKRDTPVDFDAFSLVIDQEDDFEAKVSDFRRGMLLRKNSFMIRFCCEFKVQAETETPLIYKYFPRTPVTGFLTSGFSDGEIGWNKLPRSEDKCCDTDEDTPKKKFKVCPEETCWHSYSTVLVLLTWGPVV